MKKPYIGITGFMDAEEVKAMLDLMPVDSERLLMVGVLASSKTLAGIPNKWPGRYPDIHKIKEIFPDHPLALNLVHYHTLEKDRLCQQLITLTEVAGDCFQGFQLNVTWPSPSTLGEYRRIHPDKQIVLQIGGHAFEMINHSPKQLVSRVKEYDKIAEYVLLDPSGGKGQPFDTECAWEYLEALKAEKLDQMGFGVAGGLGSKTLNLVEPLLQDFPDLSIDAEGRLRDQDDNLDLQKAGEYLKKSLAMFVGAAR